MKGRPKKYIDREKYTKTSDAPYWKVGRILTRSEQEGFLALLDQDWRMIDACKQLGFGYASVLMTRQRIPEFDKEVVDIKEGYVERAEEALFRSAFGQQTTSTKKYVRAYEDGKPLDNEDGTPKMILKEETIKEHPISDAALTIILAAWRERYQSKSSLLVGTCIDYKNPVSVKAALIAKAAEFAGTLEMAGPAKPALIESEDDEDE